MERGGGNTGQERGVKEGEEEYVGGGVGSRGQEKGVKEGEDKCVRGEGARRGQEMGLRGNKWEQVETSGKMIDCVAIPIHC